MDIKKGVYHAVVMLALLYGSETWVVKSPNMKWLEGYHNWCIVGVSGARQWKKWITGNSFGMSRKWLR